MDPLQSVDAIKSPMWSFLNKPDFWIGIIIGAVGIIFSGLAFIEARRAKVAATKAERTVKIQTIAIELTEVCQKLDKLRRDIHFDEARDLLTEISRKIRRFISPFQNEHGLENTITTLVEALDNAKKSLNAVRPDAAIEEAEATNAVYNAIEGDFATINNSVAALIGLLEKKTMDFGDADGTEGKN